MGFGFQVFVLDLFSNIQLAPVMPSLGFRVQRERAPAYCSLVCVPPHGPTSKLTAPRYKQRMEAVKTMCHDATGSLQLWASSGSKFCKTLLLYSPGEVCLTKHKTSAHQSNWTVRMFRQTIRQSYTEAVLRLKLYSPNPGSIPYNCPKPLPSTIRP